MIRVGSGAFIACLCLYVVENFNVHFLRTNCFHVNQKGCALVLQRDLEYWIIGDAFKTLILTWDLEYWIRDDIHKKKIILNGHCPLSSDPPAPLA